MTIAAADTTGKLGQVFDPRNNALNAWRLILAAQVMLFHSFPITGRMPPHATLQLMFSVGVDGFFAISGFLITSSWLRRPRLREYLAARGLRILPGLWVCLVVTAFIIAPIAVAIKGGSIRQLLLSDGPIGYVWKNAAVLYVQKDISDTPQGIPLSERWNGSLWSLIFEVACYLAVAVIGVVGLAKYRWVSPIMLGLGIGLALMLPPLTFPGVWTIGQLAARSAIMFAAGAVLYQWRNVIPARWWLVAICAVVVVAAGVLLPDYRVVAGLALAYAVVVSGALIHNKHLRLRTDLSYGVYIYAYPVQQLLAILGLVALNPFAFFAVATAATAPLAAASWFLIEKPAMSLKSRLQHRAKTTTSINPVGSDHR
jgi:peptidoglycan/LPS O-acetylase OafA/YrhL